MACACKVNQEIAYLQKKYGHNMPKSKTSDIRGMVSTFFKEVGIALIMLPFLPVMIIGLLIQVIFGKKGSIKIDKIFKLRKKHGEK